MLGEHFTLQISSYVYFSFREEKRRPPPLHLYTWEANRARVETPETEFLFSLRRLELVAPSSPECTQCTRPWTEQCEEAGRERQELSPCSGSSLKAGFAQVFSLTWNILPASAVRCREDQCCHLDFSCCLTSTPVTSWVLTFTPARAADPAVHQRNKLGPFCFTPCLSCLSLPAGWEHKQHSRLLGGRAAVFPLPAQKSGQNRGRRGKAKQPDAKSLTKGKNQGKAALALTASSSVSMWITLQQCNVWGGSMGFSSMPRLHYSYQSQRLSHTWSDCAEEMSFSHGSPASKLVSGSARLDSQLFLQFIEGSLPHCLVSHE